MVSHRHGFRGRQPKPRRMLAGDMPQADKALGFVDRDEIQHPVAKAARAQGRIIGEPFRAVRRGPAPANGERAGIIPVKERNEGADALFQQRINQPVIKRSSVGVKPPASVGQQAGPGEGKAVAGDAQVGHQRHIFPKQVEVIAGALAGAPVRDPSGHFGKAVPHGRPLAPFPGRALDLIGGGGHAPEKLLGEAHLLTPSRRPP